MKISKKRYIQGFLLSVVALGIVRCVFPQLAGNNTTNIAQKKIITEEKKDTLPAASLASTIESSSVNKITSTFFDTNGKEVKHKIYSVPSYKDAFPDQNDVQLISANQYGVRPVTNREDAEKRKNELVYIGSNPFFYVESLKQSIPYLVPRASVLLEEIGKTFFDSLAIKGIPLHQIIVTSVLRTQEDVMKLRNYNKNATENSCHLYGTTFDICYNRYRTVADPQGVSRRKVRNDTLKWVLSEVLKDIRMQNKCHIKYEVHQGCFHITVK